MTLRRTLIRGGTLLDMYGQRPGDVLVETADGLGTIAAVGEGLSADGADVLDASGCWVTPGLVDIQVHFREPGGTEAEDIDSGARAAALGGMTAVVMMPNTSPTIDTVDVVRDVLASARTAPCDVYTSAAISMDRAGERLVDFRALYDAGIRVFTDDGQSLANAKLMREALEATTRLPGAVISQHCEEETLVEGGAINEGEIAAKLGVQGRPAAAEEIIVARDIALVRLTGGRYHVLHLSSRYALAHVRAAKGLGLKVTCEATPQHLVLTHHDVERLGTVGKMNPPLREEVDVEALRAGLADGTIDAIATDHAPHPPDRKALPLDQAPPGMLGVETAAAVAFTELVGGGVVTEDQAVAALSWQPAAIAGLTRHGRPLAVGEPANITVLDADHRWTVDNASTASKSANTPWHGRELTAKVRHTVLEGDAVVVDGALTR